ncbi:MAG: phage neck terminator protein [Candidatus Adiutrix sp.]
MRKKSVKKPQGLLKSAPNAFEAIYDFILEHAKPPINRDNIYRAYENRASLPASSNDYAVINLTEESAIGTAIETYKLIGSKLVCQQKSLKRLMGTINFCSFDDKAHKWASSLALALSSSWGVNFFTVRHLGLLYSEGLKETSFVGDGREFVHSWQLTAHFSYYRCLETESQGAELVEINRIENIDCHHHHKN